MNIQHSSETDQWFTPIEIINRVKEVLGEINLDPASSIEANKRVGAQNIITVEQNSLISEWSGGSIFLNPPGGKLKNKSNMVLFWQKLMEHKERGLLKEAIFLAFSLEALQSTQGKDCSSIGEFTLCIPKKRIAFDKPDGTKGSVPSHSNVIVYIPGTVNNRDKFVKAFETLGIIINQPDNSEESIFEATKKLGW